MFCASHEFHLGPVFNKSPHESNRVINRFLCKCTVVEATRALTNSKRTDTIEFEVSQMARRQSNQLHEDLFSTGDTSPDPLRDRASRSEPATLHTPQRIDLQGAASQAGSGEKTRMSVT